MIVGLETAIYNFRIENNAFSVVIFLIRYDNRYQEFLCKFYEISAISAKNNF